MKILVDENIPNLTVSTLRKAGHDVMDIRGTPWQGIGEDELWQLAQAEARLLVTTDKGFSEHRDERHHGILIVRLRQPNEEMSLDGLQWLCRELGIHWHRVIMSL